MTMPVPAHPAVAALASALEQTAGMLRVPVEGVRVLSLEAVDWPDSCLGLPTDGEACADVVTPGYLVRLHDGFTWRADQRGTVRRQRREPYPDTEVRLRYSVEGGIAGGSTSFETDSRQLSEEDEAELLRLIEAADFFDVANPGPTGVVYDGVTTRLWIARGRRHHEIVRGDGIEADDSEALRALLAWAAERTPPMFPRGATDVEGEPVGRA